MISDSVVTLRAPELTDVDAMYIWENDRESWADGRVRAPMSRQMLWDYVSGYNPDCYAAGQLRMIIVENATGEAVGALDLYDVDALNRRAGIGIAVSAPKRRSGFALRAIELMCVYAWRDLGLHQLWAVAGRDNKASGALFVRAGFAVSGCLRSWIRIGERYGDAYFYQRLLVDGNLPDK